MRAHLQRPLADLSIVDKELRYLQVARAGDAQIGAARHEVAGQQQLAEVAVEGTQVGDKAARNCAVACIDSAGGYSDALLEACTSIFP